MNHAALVTDLRHGYPSPLRIKAAEAIEELIAEIERLTRVAFQASAERDEARMEISSLTDQKPTAYGIRQITDDEGVEEWEDIRTSPDVAKDEADGMMETGRGERYEVVPLYRTAGAQPTVTCQIYGHVVGACLECNTHSEVDELQETITAQRKVLEQALEALNVMQEDVVSTPNAYEAQRQAVRAILEVLHE